MDKPNQPELGFLDHLEELRTVFMRVILLLAILFPICFYFAPDLLELLVKYLGQPDFKLRYFSPLEPFWVQTKIGLFGAIILGMPFILWQMWQFIAPGLYQHERYFFVRLTTTAMLLFVIGAVFCGAFILPLVISFSMSYASDALEPAIGLEKFVSMVLMMLFGFGLMFEFPIVIYMLVRSGIVKIEAVKKQRPVIVIIILFLSAVLTPPDVISQVMMGVPTYLLFELSLLFAGMKKHKESDDIHDDDDDNDNDKSPPSLSTKKEPPPMKDSLETDDYFDYNSDPLPRKSRSVPGRSPASCMRKKRRRK